MESGKREKERTEREPGTKAAERSAVGKQQNQTFKRAAGGFHIIVWEGKYKYLQENTLEKRSIKGQSQSEASLQGNGT